MTLLSVSSRTLGRALLPMTLIVAACVKIEDGPAKRVDTAAAALAALGASDSAAPRSAGITGDPFADSAIVIRRNPALLTKALANDTASTLTVLDSAPVSMPTETDIGILRAGMIVPVGGVPVSALRDTYNEIRGGTRRHEAMDIAAPRGAPVLSAAGGRVLKLFDSKAGGLMVYAADSSERFILMYAHLDAYAPGLVEGQPLRRGQALGVVGTTGNAPPTVPHLHFAVARTNDVKQWWKGVPVNPYPLLAR